MSLAIQQGVMDELVELSWMFRQNAGLKNGLPDVKRLPVPRLTADPPQSSTTTVKIDETKTTTDTTANTGPTAVTPTVTPIQTPADTADTKSPSQGATAADTDRSSLLRRAAPWLLATGLAAAGFGVPLGWMLHKAPVTTSTTIVTPTPTQIQSQNRSLLQWLQDHGKHLPGDAKWQQP